MVSPKPSSTHLSGDLEPESFHKPDSDRFPRPRRFKLLYNSVRPCATKLPKPKALPVPKSAQASGPEAPMDSYAPW